MSKRKRISNPMEDYKLPECIPPLDFKSQALKLSGYKPERATVLNNN
jgi:hypothetical protein